MSAPYYSVGGGFVMAQTNNGSRTPRDRILGFCTRDNGNVHPAPYPFSTAAQLLAQCARSGLRLIAEVVRANEFSARPEAHSTRPRTRCSTRLRLGFLLPAFCPAGRYLRRANALGDPVERACREGFFSAGERRVGPVMQDPQVPWIGSILYALAVNKRRRAQDRHLA